MVCGEMAVIHQLSATVGKGSSVCMTCVLRPFLRVHCHVRFAETENYLGAALHNDSSLTHSSQRGATVAGG